MRSALCLLPSVGVATPAELRAARADTPGRYRDFQKIMFRAVTRQVTKDDFSNPKWDDGRDANALLGAFVKGDGFRTPLERVQTYNRMYWYRTLDSLWEDFPGVRAIVGKKFTPLAEAYLEKHPSTSFTLRHLGHAFPAWLKKNSAKLPTKIAAMAAECASVEWALCQAFELETLPAFDPASLGDPEKLKLSLQPHLALFTLKYGIPDFLVALREPVNEHAEPGNAAATSGPESRAVKKPKAVLPKVGITRAVVYRTPDNGIATLEIDGVQAGLLADLAAGTTLGAALGKLARKRRAPGPEQIGRWFASWNSRGWLVAGGAKRETRKATPRVAARS